MIWGFRNIKLFIMICVMIFYIGGFGSVLVRPISLGVRMGVLEGGGEVDVTYIF